MGVANIGSRIPFSRLHPLHWLLFTGISSNVWKNRSCFKPTMIFKRDSPPSENDFLIEVPN